MSSTDPHPAPLGTGTSLLLMAMFQDAYRQEVAAEEDVHRTLPFFATALGFVVAAINYVVAQLPSLDTLARPYLPLPGGLLNHHALARTWPLLLAILLLVGAVVLSVGVLTFLAAATRRLDYERVGPETAHLVRARSLQEYHARLGLAGVDLDEATGSDLRRQLLDDYAVCLAFNRRLIRKRLYYRARAVSCLLLSLLCALLATTLVLVGSRIGLF